MDPVEVKIPGSVVDVMERLTFKGNLAYLPKHDNGKPWKVETIGRFCLVMRKLTGKKGQQPVSPVMFPEGVSARDAVLDAIATGVVPD